MTAKVKVAVRPSIEVIGGHDVLVDGKKVAQFWFFRDVRDRHGRKQISCNGIIEFFDEEGGVSRTRPLGDYAWMADVRKDVKAHFSGEYPVFGQ
jgi:hypothetical protein